MNQLQLTIVVAITIGFSQIITAQDEEKPAVSAEELAKKLSNPVAALISVSFQNNMDLGIRLLQL